MFSLKPSNGGAMTMSCTSKKGIGSSNSFYCRASASVAMVGSKKKKKANFYELLSLDYSEKVGPDEIKRAYRSMALRHHPDVCPNSMKESSTSVFVELHQAYVTLSDPSSRKAYDRELQLSGEADGVSARRTGFARETWEAQLQELVRRSESRERARSWFRRDN